MTTKEIREIASVSIPAPCAQDRHAWERRIDATRYLALGGFLALIALGLWFVRFGGLNADEGFYLLAARLVADGLVPYRDFGITQPPGMPWIYSVLLHAFGWSLTGIRNAGLFLVVLTAATGLLWCARQKSWRVGAVFMLLLLASPGWLAFAVKGKTYALAGLPVLVGTLAILGRGAPGLRLTILLAAAAAGAMTRLPTVAFFAVGWIALVVQVPAWKGRIWSVVTAVVLVFLMIWMGGHGAWEQARFWTMDYHRLGLAERSAAVRWGGLFDLGPGLCLCLVVSGVLAVKTRQKALTVAWLAVVLAIVANVGTSRGYGEYATPLFPAAALVAAMAMEPLVSSCRSGRCRLFVALAVVLFLGMGWIRPPETDASVIPSSEEAAAFVREAVPAHKWVVGSMPEIAVAAGRSVPVELAMGKFAFTESLDYAQASRFHMVTLARLVELLEDSNCGAFVVSVGQSWNFAWTMPELRYASDETLKEIKGCLSSRFEVAFTSPHYVVFLPKGTDVRID